MIYISNTKVVVGCDLRIFGGVIEQKCSNCSVSCRIRGVLVIPEAQNERIKRKNRAGEAAG